MVIDRFLNLPRHPTITRVRRRLGISDRLAADLYWKLLSPFVPKTRSIHIDEQSFTFGITHLPEHYLFEHFDESELVADLVRELSGDDVFWDVGANVGVFTVIAAAQGAEVYAFEPMARNVDRIRDNLDRNAVESTLDDRALAGKAGSVELTLSSDLPGAQGSEIVTSGAAGSKLSVAAVPGDAVEYPNPSVIKIDVEGAEVAVLDGLHSTLAADRCRVVYIEVHADRLEQQGHRPADIESRLTNLGYEVTELGPQFAHRKRWKAIRSPV